MAQNRIAVEIYNLVETVSKSLATTKPGMEAVLATMNSPDNLGSVPAQAKELAIAQHLLAQSQDVPEFLSRYRAHITRQTGGIELREQG